jgi:excisionase family DNA binding protein
VAVKVDGENRPLPGTPVLQISAPVSAIRSLSACRAENGAIDWVQKRQEWIVDEKNRRAAAAILPSTTMMTLQEVAEYLRVTRSTIHRLLQRNQIPAFRIGRHWRFNVEEIDNWCASRVLSKEYKPTV